MKVRSRITSRTKPSDTRPDKRQRKREFVMIDITSDPHLRSALSALAAAKYRGNCSAAARAAILKAAGEVPIE